MSKRIYTDEERRTRHAESTRRYRAKIGRDAANKLTALYWCKQHGYHIVDQEGREIE